MIALVAGLSHSLLVGGPPTRTGGARCASSPCMAESPRKLRVGLVGGGTVGGGIVTILEGARELQASLGVDVEIATICVRDKAKPRDFPLPAGCAVVDDVEEILGDGIDDSDVDATSEEAAANFHLDGHGGGVAVGGGVPGLRAAPNFTPAHERLQRRMENYSSNHINQVKHLNDTANAFNTIVREDTKKLQKKFVDNNKPKKATKNKSSNNEINSSSKTSNMKPQIQQANGLKRPHPGANSTSSSTSNVLGGCPGGVSDAASEAKRMNLDQSNNATAIKLEIGRAHV